MPTRTDAEEGEEVVKLSDYEWVSDPGNPLPVDGLALVFREGRACVMVRVRGLDGWHEAMSAPTTEASTEESLACAVDFRRDQGWCGQPVTEHDAAEKDERS